LFERFSERARQVVVLASEEARALGHDHIGTEHLLIAVLREGGGAPAVRASVSVTADEARAAVIAILGRGSEGSPPQLSFTPRAKRALELGLRQALGLGRREVGPEHLLLALLAESEGVAARILADAGADAGAIFATVIGMDADWREVPRADPPHPLEVVPEVEIDLGWRGRPIALAALGAVVLARSAFDPRRTGMLVPVEMQVLVHLALAARKDEGSSPGEEMGSLPVALACDQHDVEQAVGSLLGRRLVGPAGIDEDRVVITPLGAARVEDWLRRTASLFAGWPPTVPGVDDV
jgi:Clp amino terminal domain, pathogenicity island component